jgi:hypothetical protein
MNNMPNPDAPPCGCRWFDEAAKNPDIPVVFDSRMNEFHLTHNNDRGYSLFYHCPFCGGRAPESLRKTFFTDVTHEESVRLHNLTKHIKTESEFLDEFGKPDHEFDIGGSMTTAGSDSQPRETFIGARKLVYKQLSDIADVNVQINRYGKLKISYSGKYIGPKRQTEQDAAANP